MKIKEERQNNLLKNTKNNKQLDDVASTMQTEKKQQISSEIGTMQTNQEYILNLENIKLNYHSQKGETLAIKNISLNVSPGEFICLVGPSGCGKTTLLSLIAGILTPSSGSIKIASQNTVKNKNNYHKNVGYMFQKDNLLEWRTIWKNVVLGFEINNTLTNENKELAESLLKKYGLLEFKDKYPRELSGGMRQRVALIRTLVLKPDILLLDEPFSALDYQTRINVCEDVSNILRQENKTVIMVTHDIAESISFSDRIIVLSKRPSVIKNEHKICLKNTSPFKRREEDGFSKYFDEIWSELNDENEQAKT